MLAALVRAGVIAEEKIIGPDRDDVLEALVEAIETDAISRAQIEQTRPTGD